MVVQQSYHTEESSQNHLWRGKNAKLVDGGF